MKVMKFGGSSVASPARIKKVAKIVLESAREERVVVVVSAFQGVTDLLLECARRAERRDLTYEHLYDQLVQRHHAAVDELHGKGKGKSIRGNVDGLLFELRDALHGIHLLRHSPPRALDLVASFGERLSAFIISSYLNKFWRSVPIDARECVVTDDQFTKATVLFEKTTPAIRRRFRGLRSKGQQDAIPVVTGFIGATEDGLTTTIGRNGSDYTAAILGGALDVSVIEIWTDVDGVLSADPRPVPPAFVLPQLSYEEAMELSYFGASVLHSATIAPAVVKSIPIRIKNSLNPSAPGTLISKKVRSWDGVVKGITSVDGITLLTLRGMAMVGVPGTAQRLFHALAGYGVNVILISQASSEHTICFAVRTADAPRARKAIHQEFRHELHNNLTSLDEKADQTIVAVVGEGMKGTPGVAGKVCQALGMNGVNISAIAQGASERNISLVIDGSQKVRGLNVIHRTFFEKKKRLDLIVIGVGNIGGALLKQLHQQQEWFQSQHYDVRVCGVANSRRFFLAPQGVDLSRWREQLQNSRHRMDAHTLATCVKSMELANAAVVDCTASSEIVDAYLDFVEANLHIITPNKKANVLPRRRYADLIDVLKKRQKHFLYEANVGAGLPVISTLRNLIASGDIIMKIEGIFSGTLSYLFNSFDGKKSFSETVREAHQLGYTEPDPREDLSGRDVARKLLILARQLGWEIDLQDIPSDNIVPVSLRMGRFSAGFFKRFAAYDGAMRRRLENANAHDAVLRYVGTVENKKGRAKLTEFPRGHPFAATKGSDNVVVFTTQRYSKSPLVIQGPGAGADVTAMGVFSDILKLLHYLPC
jgi:aspartokinase/homoserine dehydrogenase 1